MKVQDAIAEDKNRLGGQGHAKNADGIEAFIDTDGDV